MLGQRSPLHLSDEWKHYLRNPQGALELYAACMNKCLTSHVLVRYWLMYTGCFIFDRDRVKK